MNPLEIIEPSRKAGEYVQSLQGVKLDKNELEQLDRCLDTLDEMDNFIEKELKRIDKLLRESGEYDPVHISDDHVPIEYE